MPRKSDKIKIANSEFDRRIKLTNNDKELIRWLREEEQISYKKLADRFNVSKRSIIFICKPETLEKNKKLRENRGGWKVYYDKERNTKSIREHRNYKRDLYLKNKI